MEKDDLRNNVHNLSELNVNKKFFLSNYSYFKLTVFSQEIKLKYGCYLSNIFLN